MAQENLVEQGIIHLPDIPVSNILIRLPPRFVIRCKLVCKQWACLISDPFFVRNYLSRSQSPSWTVIGERVKDRVIDYDFPKQICSRQDFHMLCLSTARKRKRHETYKVLGGDNGMILFALVDRYNGFTYTSCSRYYICNLAIRKLIPVSPPTPKSLTIELLWGSGLVTRVRNHVLESFRVVLLWPDPETGCLRFRVYASETQEWNEYIVPSKIPTPRILIDTLPTALNQTLHWVTKDGSLIAYDPYAGPDRIRVIPPPEDTAALDAPDAKFISRLYDAPEGKLRCLKWFAGNGPCARFKQWVLEDYGSWRVSRESAVPGRALSESFPMFFDPFDRDVLYLGHARVGSLVWYDVRTRMSEVVQEYASHGGRTNEKLFPWYLTFLIEVMPCNTMPFWLKLCLGNLVI